MADMHTSLRILSDAKADQRVRDAIGRALTEAFPSFTGAVSPETWARLPLALLTRAEFFARTQDDPPEWADLTTEQAAPIIAAYVDEHFEEAPSDNIRAVEGRLADVGGIDGGPLTASSESEEVSLLDLSPEDYRVALADLTRTRRSEGKTPAWCIEQSRVRVGPIPLAEAEQIIRKVWAEVTASEQGEVMPEPAKEDAQLS